MRKVMLAVWVGVEVNLESRGYHSLVGMRSRLGVFAGEGSLCKVSIEH